MLQKYSEQKSGVTKTATVNQKVLKYKRHPK